MSTIDEMHTALAAARLNRNEDFAQIDLIMRLIFNDQLEERYRNGICRGLSMTWLSRVKAGRGAAFVESLYADPPSQALLQLVTGFQRLQDTAEAHEALARENRLESCIDGHGDQKTKTFCSRLLPEQTGGNELPLDELGKWMTATVAPRYFLIRVNRHAMAAVGSKTGELQFFDSNGGIVRTKKVNKMVEFLKAYFRIQRIENSYKGGIPPVVDNQNRVLMKVYKYK